VYGQTNGHSHADGPFHRAALNVCADVKRLLIQVGAGAIGDAGHRGRRLKPLQMPKNWTQVRKPVVNLMARVKVALKTGAQSKLCKSVVTATTNKARKALAAAQTCTPLP